MSHRESELTDLSLKRLNLAPTVTFFGIPDHLFCEISWYVLTQSQTIRVSLSNTILRLPLDWELGEHYFGNVSQTLQAESDRREMKVGRQSIIKPE